jgi:sec-independent protein translocase protein TatA
MFGLGTWEILLILLILLLLFGARRLPEIGGSLGKGIREFKSSVKEVESDVRRELQGGEPPQSSPQAKEPARPEAEGRKEPQ